MDSGDHPSTVIRMNPFVPVLEGSSHFLLRFPEHQLHCSVPGNEVGFQVPVPDDIVGGKVDQPVAFLALAQGFLQPDLIGDVSKEVGRTDLSAMRVVDGVEPQVIDLPFQLRWTKLHRDAEGLSFQGPFPQGPGLLLLLRPRCHGLDHARADFDVPPPQPLELPPVSVVKKDVPKFIVLCGDEVFGSLGNALDDSVGTLQRIFGASALGDVGDGLDGPDDGPVRHADRGCAGQEKKRFITVLPVQDQLFMMNALPLQGPPTRKVLMVGNTPIRCLDPEHLHPLGNRTADIFLGKPQNPFSSRVHVGDDMVRVIENDALHRRVEGCFKPQ